MSNKRDKYLLGALGMMMASNNPGMAHTLGNNFWSATPGYTKRFGVKKQRTRKGNLLRKSKRKIARKSRKINTR